MGIEDREWYREHHRDRKEQQANVESRRLKESRDSQNNIKRWARFGDWRNDALAPPKKTRSQGRIPSQQSNSLPDNPAGQGIKWILFASLVLNVVLLMKLLE